MQSFVKYAQFEEFWERLEPHTPYGKDVRRECPFYAKQEELEPLWQDCDKASSLLQLQTVNLSRLRYFLKRLPRFRQAPLTIYDEADIFEYKKFLCNYHQLLDLLPDDIKRHFDLRFTSASLEDLLGRGDQYAETFYIADAYSPALHAVRDQIREVDQAIANHLRQRSSLVEEGLGWVFSGDFLVVRKSEVSAFTPIQTALLETQLTLEPYDETHNLVRWRPQSELIAWQEQRCQLGISERQAEAQVLQSLSAAINAELVNINGYRQSVLRFDMALARAELAQRYHLARPHINASCAEPIVIAQGRFIPCQENCQRLEARYVPLDLTLDKPHAVLFGSNMGGKTITLKTLAFLQLCVQHGLYVPAQEFRTPLFAHLHYIGEGRCDTPQQGLSGFGFEMSQFCAAYRDRELPTLVLFDEFARTTNSREAEALISAILADLGQFPQVRTLFSSHFHNIARLPQVAFFKMRGLKSQELAALPAASLSPEDRLRQLNSLLDYRVQPDPETLQSSDALAIAALLGVPSAIVKEARQRLNG